MKEWNRKGELLILSVSNRAGLFYLPRLGGEGGGGDTIADKNVG